MDDKELRDDINELARKDYNDTVEYLESSLGIENPCRLFTMEPDITEEELKLRNVLKQWIDLLKHIATCEDHPLFALFKKSLTEEELKIALEIIENHELLPPPDDIFAYMDSFMCKCWHDDTAEECECPDNVNHMNCCYCWGCGRIIAIKKEEPND
jgi:hypothetical protein